MKSLIVFLSRGNGVGVFDVRIPYADTVALVYFADNLRGNSRYETIRGNVPRDNRSRRDNAVFAYPNAVAESYRRNVEKRAVMPDKNKTNRGLTASF